MRGGIDAQTQASVRVEHAQVSGIGLWPLHGLTLEVPFVHEHHAAAVWEHRGREGAGHRFALVRPPKLDDPGGAGAIPKFNRPF